MLEPQSDSCDWQRVSRFHAIYWPAILRLAGVRLPTRLLVHGYVTVEGQKTRKSLGTPVDPVALAGEFGADTFRYYLLCHIRSCDEGGYSKKRLESAYVTDLANRLGNLLNRTLGLITRYTNGRVPEPAEYFAVGRKLIEACAALPEKVDAAIGEYRLDAAISEVWNVVQKANQYVSEVAPWEKACEGSSQLVRTCLFVLAETLLVVGCFVSVFLPRGGEKLLQKLGAVYDALDSDTRIGFCWILWLRAVSPDGLLFPKRF